MSSSNTLSIILTIMTQFWSGRRWYQSMGSAQHSMPVPIWTSSKPVFDSSLIMAVTHTSVHFCPTNSFAASTSSTSSLTDSLTHHTNSVPMPLCLLTHPSGYSSKSTHIWCTRNANSELFLPNQFALPAATFQAFVNGAFEICWLPSRDRWIKRILTIKQWAPSMTS